METAYRSVIWRWKQWRGRYDSEEREKVVDVPYKRYPRTFVPPTSIEFLIRARTNGDKIVAVEPTDFTTANESWLLTAVNLFLEIFGECEILTQNLDNIIQAPVRQLNWNVLPLGQHPWKSILGGINPLIQKQPAGNQPLIRKRLETINSVGPEFVAVGRGGFTGYLVFAFPAKKLFVLESIHHGNATYVLGKKWETISKLSKAEILANNLHIHRVIHLADWEQNIRKILR